MIDLSEPIIRLGPYTLITVEQGYVGVTQDNGRQVMLDGGNVYLLTHKNWKFEKIVSIKINTDELKRIEAASADNVVLVVDATVLWRISDVETAVRMSEETMRADGSDPRSGELNKLRDGVLKQALASMAAFVGTINFSDKLAASALNQRMRDDQGSVVQAKAVSSATEATVADVDAYSIYNSDKLRDAMTHANETTRSYGVEIISINIISAIPKDDTLQRSLAAGAVAAAESQTLETTAQGKSRALQIEAAAQAKQTLILAQADADAEILRAQGAKEAADLLATNPVSGDLAKIERTGIALSGNGNNSSFFFGAQPQELGYLLANSEIVKAKK